MTWEDMWTILQKQNVEKLNGQCKNPICAPESMEEPKASPLIGTTSGDRKGKR